MEGARPTWTDGRLDDLSRHVEDGFNRVDADIRSLRTEMNNRFDTEGGRIDRRFDAVDARFDSVDVRFDKLEGRFDSLQRVLIVAGASAFVSFVGVAISVLATSS